MRKLTVSRTFQSRSAWPGVVEAPFIRMRGQWLAALGFTAGRQIEIVEKPGEITIRLMEGDAAHGKNPVRFAD